MRPKIRLSSCAKMGIKSESKKSTESYVGASHVLLMMESSMALSKPLESTHLIMSRMERTQQVAERIMVAAHICFFVFM